MAVLAAGNDGIVPGHLAAHTRHREASLNTGLLSTAKRLPDGVDNVAPHPLAIEDEDAASQSDLVGRQADATGVVHRLQHVGDESFETGIEDGDNLGCGIQHWVAEEADIADGHGAKVYWLTPDPHVLANVHRVDLNPQG